MREMRRAAVLFLLAPMLGAGPDDEGPGPIDGKAILEHIKVLSSDKNKGRAAGSPGAFAAADYIAARLKQLGLEPVGDKGTWFQNFDLPKGFTIRKETSLTATLGSRKATLSYDKDLKPLTLSGPGDVV